MKTKHTRQRIAASAMFLILTACGGDSLVGPVGAEGGIAAPESSELWDLPGLTTDTRVCTTRPGEIISGDFEVRVRTIQLRDAARDVDVQVDVSVPIAQSGLPPVFGHGPYPVVVFSHGGAPLDGFTAEELPIFPEFTRFWTSKGYIVLAPRHRVAGSFFTDGHEARSLDLHFTLDRAQELVRRVDATAFLDTRYPVVAGHSSGAFAAALVTGMTVPDPVLGIRTDLSDPRFRSAILLAGVPDSMGGYEWYDPDWSGLRMPLLSIVGSEDLNNAPGAVPDDYLAIIRLSPPGGKHGVIVNGAGHFLGARSTRDAAGTLEASQTATALFLRAYAPPPSWRAVTALADSAFCGLVHPSLLEVEYYATSFPGMSSAVTAEPKGREVAPVETAFQWEIDRR